MLDARAPVGRRRRIGKVVAVDMRHMTELGIFDRRHRVDRIGAGNIERDRVKRRKHTDIGNDGRVIFGMTVAVGRNVNDAFLAIDRTLSDPSF